MKKILLSLVAAASFAMTAKAQVSFIPKVGVTFANVAFKQKVEGQGSVTGLLFGAGFNLPLDSDGFFSLQPELLYIQKGASGTDNGIKGEVQYNYFELPVLAKISFGSETVKAYVNAGPSIGYAYKS